MCPPRVLTKINPTLYSTTRMVIGGKTLNLFGIGIACKITQYRESRLRLWSWKCKGLLYLKLEKKLMKIRRWYVKRYYDICRYICISRITNNQNVSYYAIPLQWRHNERDCVWNHHPRDCLIQPFIRAQIKENIKAPRHWPLCGDFTGDRRIHRTKGPVKQEMFPFSDVIML